MLKAINNRSSKSVIAFFITVSVFALIYIFLNSDKKHEEHVTTIQSSGETEVKNSEPENQGLASDKSKKNIEHIEIADSVDTNEQHLSWIEGALLNNQLSWDKKWTDSLAAGSRQFSENYLDAVGIRANHRQVKVVDDCHVVREESLTYGVDL